MIGAKKVFGRGKKESVHLMLRGAPQTGAHRAQELKLAIGSAKGTDELGKKKKAHFKERSAVPLTHRANTCL